MRHSHLTEEEKRSVLDQKGDPEGYHSAFDQLLMCKIKQIDPELSAELMELRKQGIFWYA